MKLDALFKSKDNRLYTLDGAEVTVVGCPVLAAEKCASGTVPADSCCGAESLCAVELPWTLVGTEEGGYNEEFLAGLRDWLKALEAEKRFAFIVPVSQGVLGDADGVSFTASMKHCARRVKDCISVAGFAVPEGVDSESFRAALREKHEQYVYFSRDEKILADGEVVRF